MFAASSSASLRVGIAVQEVKTEIFRKSIHILIAAVPFLAAIHTPITLFIVAAGTLLYTIAEFFRTNGHEVFIISKITLLASRNQDRGHFVLGPVTLGIGAMLALLLYPEPAATIAIFALAFGDSISSLVGKVYGNIRIPFTGGKTFAGSFACLLVVSFITYRITGNAGMAILIGAVAAFLEALPSRDLDNVIMPVGTGFVASILIILGG